jgi:hypothetical protein
MILECAEENSHASPEAGIPSFKLPLRFSLVAGWTTGPASAQKMSVHGLKPKGNI